MATNEGNYTTATWDEIPMIDKVSENYAPLRGLNPGRLSSTRCLAYWSSTNSTCDFGSVLLLHEEGNRTYIRGRHDGLGLKGQISTADSTCHDPKSATLPAGQLQERELEELRGQRVVQVVFSLYGDVYILMADGTLYSSGFESNGRLGRPGNVMPSNRFGPVPINQSVRQVAAGASHALAMTTDKVFVFGSNDCGQLGIPGCDSSEEPIAVYKGTGIAAPHHVVCGANHSVILTAGGQVLTCGHGHGTGQGHDNSIPEMSEVPGLRGLHVQQVVVTCNRQERWINVRTEYISQKLPCIRTYALAGGVVYGWGDNLDGGLGLGNASEKLIFEPTVVNSGARHVTSIRCVGCVVIAGVTGDYLFWGTDINNIVTKSPQLVTGHRLPRDVCVIGGISGGLVFLDTKENHGRVFPLLHTPEKRDDAVDDRIPQDAKTEANDIPELKRLLEDNIKRENAARVTAENRPQLTETEIAESTRLLEESIERENAALEALRQSERDRLSLADRVDQIQQQVLEFQSAQQALSEQVAHGENAALEALRQSERDRLSLADRVDQLQQQVLEFQSAQQALSE